MLREERREGKTSYRQTPASNAATGETAGLNTYKQDDDSLRWFVRYGGFIINRLVDLFQVKKNVYTRNQTDTATVEFIALTCGV